MTTTTPHIAVTGAAGYTGSCVVKRLQEVHPDWQITALDNFHSGMIRQIDAVDVQHVDIRHRSELADALDGADVVLHLAALSGVEDCDENPDLAYEVNVQGTNNVAWWCHTTGGALVFPFSMAVVGDPTTFPITTDAPRTPLNWYGRSKILGERAIETFADGSFPAHLLMISNVYGAHEIDDTTVSKPVVLNFFVNRALAGEPLTVYEPGTQVRNYVHVLDIAQLYVLCAERLLTQLNDSETGVKRYAIGSEETPSVMEIAQSVKQIAREERNLDPDIELVENPRSGETLTDTFTVDTTNVREQLGWQAERTVEDAIRTALRE
ncbi:NAD-dependent epimerase/dehydratase family protein [Halocatena salina]|uniref:NAD(P)-dependent oxidoreductase n=1 Tax=Halocatena salina TaxID=2934340 RepID=A0A8T9ZYY7_9EURY|nr:NAD(P)-dependent oxidoreductase [Halocatena salina]UPM41656.1 NAD(P)-dependent oxidoreductase [Halocatena salina]